MAFCVFVFLLFFFNDTATTEIYTLSLHDALPISSAAAPRRSGVSWRRRLPRSTRSEEHTSELQSHSELVCRLLLEKKKTKLERRMLAHIKNLVQHPPRNIHSA